MAEAKHRHGALWDDQSYESYELYRPAAMDIMSWTLQGYLDEPGAIDSNRFSEIW